MRFVPILSLLLAAASAQALPTRIALPGKTLAFNLPEGMVEATNHNNGTNVLIEYVPRGETVSNWTRMVTVQAYRGLGRSTATTAEIARQAFYPAACRNGPLWRIGGELALPDGTRRTLVANGCASLPAGAYPQALRGAGEQDFILVFRDAETIYTLNYAVRGAPFRAGRPPIPLDSGEATLRTLFGEVTLNGPA